MTTTAVRVALRVRPLSTSESVIYPNETVTFISDEPRILFSGTDRSFTFDFVYRPDASQEQLYHTSVLPLVTRFLQGYQITILAYGYPGSGKSYTLGTHSRWNESKEHQGIIPRFVQTLFDDLDRNAQQKSEFHIYVSFIECHDESVRDLLNTNDTRHPVLDECSIKEHRVHRAQETLGLLQQGLQRRTDRSNDNTIAANLSHSIFSLIIKRSTLMPTTGSIPASLPADSSMTTTVATCRFVDLGTPAKRQRGKEQATSASITEYDLSTLLRTIHTFNDELTMPAPSSSNGISQFVREKNQQTLLIACVSSSVADTQQTVNVLNYGAKASTYPEQLPMISIENEATTMELKRLRDQVLQLRRQVDVLQHQRSVPENDAFTSLQNERKNMHRSAVETASELDKTKAGRDTLMLQMDMQYQQEMEQRYADTIRDLRQQVVEANQRLAYFDPSFIDAPRHSALKHHATISMALPGQHGSSHHDSDLLALLEKGSISANRRAKRKHLRVVHRARTPSTSATRKRGTHSSSRRDDVAASQKRLEDLIAMLQTDHAFDDSSDDDDDNNSTSTVSAWINKNKSKHETISVESGGIVDQHQQQQQQRKPQPKKKHQQHESHLKNGKQPPSPQLNNRRSIDPTSLSASTATTNTVTTTTANTNTTMPTTSTPNDPECSPMFGSEDDLEVLAVPTWTEAPNTESTNGSTKRESLSWTDSLMDDSDNSMATSRLSTTWTTNRSREGRRRSKDLLKMLHQVQADLLVKKELVGQLEKSEVEYTQMRESYEEKLDALQDHLLEMQKQRDLAYRKAGFRTQAPQTVLQLREARQAQEVRHSYEAKMKRLTTENHDLRRKYTQATQTVETAKNKAEGLIRRLRSDIESLKSDKKQLQKALRVESDKARESVSHLEREIQQLKRKEAMSVEAHKKMEDMYETQNQALKKRTDEVAALSSQLRQLVGHLRRTANEGTLMNEAVLEKLMNAIQYRSTKSPHRTSMIAD